MKKTPLTLAAMLLAVEPVHTKLLAADLTTGSLGLAYQESEKTYGGRLDVNTDVIKPFDIKLYIDSGFGVSMHKEVKGEYKLPSTLGLGCEIPVYEASIFGEVKYPPLAILWPAEGRGWFTEVGINFPTIFGGVYPSVSYLWVDASRLSDEIPFSRQGKRIEDMSGSVYAGLRIK